MNTTPLTKSEKRFLRALTHLEHAQEDFTLKGIAAVAGWKSAQRAYQVYEGLLRKGYIEDGKRLAVVECPVMTNAGLQAFKRAA